MTHEQRPGPSVRVVAGNPSEEEVAALVAALATVRTAGAEAGAHEPWGLSAWGAYWHRLDQRPKPGSDGWRASALPR